MVSGSCRSFVPVGVDKRFGIGFQNWTKNSFLIFGSGCRARRSRETNGVFQDLVHRGKIKGACGWTDSADDAGQRFLSGLMGFRNVFDYLPG